MNNIAQRLVHLIKVALDNEATDIHIIKTGEEVIIEERVDKKLVTIKKELDDEKLIGFIAHEAGLITTSKAAQNGNFILKVEDINVLLKVAMLVYDENNVNIVARIYKTEDDSEEDIIVPEIRDVIKYGETLSKNQKILLLDVIAEKLKVNIEDVLVFGIAQSQLETYLEEAGADTTLSMTDLVKLQKAAAGNYTELAEESIWEELSYEIKPLSEEIIKEREASK